MSFYIVLCKNCFPEFSTGSRGIVHPLFENFYWEFFFFFFFFNQLFGWIDLGISAQHIPLIIIIYIGFLPHRAYSPPLYNYSGLALSTKSYTHRISPTYCVHLLPGSQVT